MLEFYLGRTADALLGRATLERRARRLRRAFERRGGAFVKLGEHLATRVDFLPWEYSVQLSQMLDQMAPFPIEQAIEVVERATGAPLGETFRRFDPEPILSSSVACTYQAILRQGDKVVVKVRRPKIGEEFMADLRAFDWLLMLAEFLTIFRPGFTAGMREEFREYLLEELDFIQTARRQDSFRREARGTRQDFFSAPKVYLGLSSEEVVVEAFASGMWLWELLSAVEQDNEPTLQQARAMNIDPERVARRLMWVHYWSWQENTFFHADPHPDNIIIGHDSRLYFINFAVTGSLNRSQRQALFKNLNYRYERDPLNMARASLVLLEPVPAVDLMELTQKLEGYNWQVLYALEADPHSLTWQQRTSVAQWLGVLQQAREYGVVIESNVLRWLRATLLVESTAVRLDPEVDFDLIYREIETFRADQARRRITDSLLDQADGEPDETWTIQQDRIANILTDLYFRAKHSLTLPRVNFNALMSKWSFAAATFVRGLWQAGLLTLLVGLALAGSSLYLNGSLPQAQPLLRSTLTNPVYQAMLALLLFINIRLVMFRLGDKDP